MSRQNVLQMPSLSYERNVLFAIEIQDPINFQRINRGLSVSAKGLSRSPIVNASGIFVWLDEDFTKLERIIVKPGKLPYEQVELTQSQLQRPLTTILLSPTTAYQFSPGVTGLRGTLVEKQASTLRPPAPVVNAQIRIEWVDEDGDWHESNIRTKSDSKGGFVSVVNFAGNKTPLVEENLFSVRLVVERAGLRSRTSDPFKLRVGQITNPSIPNPMKFAWDDLQI